jgi:threonine/homoserine/homoserine lactone efflux protein
MLEQILLSLSVSFLAMVIPGPDMVLVLRNTFASGRCAGLQTSMGILCGNLIHITYCVFGIGMLISRSILAFSAMKYVAAAYLIYLGIMSVRAGTKNLEASDIQGGRLTRSWFVQGFVNNLLNPKGALFYLGVFTTVITPETSPTAMFLLILIMMLVSASFWICFVYTLDRRTLRDVVERSQQTVNRVFGALLILLGLRVASMSR